MVIQHIMVMVLCGCRLYRSYNGYGVKWLYGYTADIMVMGYVVTQQTQWLWWYVVLQ